uniref:LITAF domain-containing protein n=1 Tax=Meloidogyne enterolobii TaxID=390850 RepID=A0A6V7WQV8_MELEN|nr:unnamed protein product [Meloidogyne enterolobii]
MSIQQQQPTSPFNIPEPPPPYSSPSVPEQQIFTTTQSSSPTYTSNFPPPSNNQNNNNNKYTTNIPFNQQQTQQQQIPQNINPPLLFIYCLQGVFPPFQHQQQPSFVVPNIQQQQRQQQQPSQLKIIYSIPLGPHEANMECFNCKQTIRTRVINRPGLLSWLICGALALFGCWPCCVLPFCMQSCQDTEHWCPNCNAFIGKYSRI